MKSQKARLLNLLVERTIESKSLPCSKEGNRSLDGNLFRQQTPEKISITRCDSLKGYQFVGMKEVKSYCQKMNKAKILGKKYSSVRGASKIFSSQKIREEDNLMSRVQLLNVKKNENHEDSILPFTNNENSNNLSKQQYSSFHHSISSVNLEHQFSLQKVKNSYRNYQEGWTRTEEFNQKTKGFPSLMRLAAQEREKKEMKENQAIKHLKKHLQSYMWQEMLRNDRNLKDYYRKTEQKQTKIRRNLISVYGKNKYELEKEWVNIKGDEGYRFKMLKKPTQE